METVTTLNKNNEEKILTEKLKNFRKDKIFRLPKIRRKVVEENGTDII